MDPELTGLLRTEQYSLAAGAKEGLLVGMLNRLTDHHRLHCTGYRRILEAAYKGSAHASCVADVPYLPVSLFKSIELKSVEDVDVFKVMTSSGTTSGAVSRIYLDVDTATAQSRALATIVTHYLGGKRRPMLIVDYPGVIKDRREYSARGAGILGMMNFGRDHLYALDARMRVDRAALESWLASHAGEELLIFGITFMVWEHLREPLKDQGIDLSRASLVHSGGWKKLADRAVSRDVFRAGLSQAFGLTRVHDFYGMVEQVGSVFFECPAGYFHPPNFAEVVVRDPRTWRPAATGDEGVVEVLSLLPRSYPGHALLTEDVGVIHGVDDCPCGRLGRRFRIMGRVPKAEIRGCSDTYVQPG